MLKVFLVEDEVVMRNGIKNNIPWEKEGFAFVGEASDGELAYPMIRAEQPDILITDIRMPFMDGLELARLVKKDLPDIKIIILSGYNDFDYAKEAISIGVTDYLLKPVSPSKFLEAVKKVAEVIETEREDRNILEQYQKEMEENAQLEKNRLWSSLTSNRKRPAAAQLLESGKRLGIDFTASAFQIFLFKVFSIDGSDSRWESVREISEEVASQAQEEQDLVLFDRSPEGFAFLFKGHSQEETERQLAQEIHFLQDVCGRYPGLFYFGGIGSTVSRLGDIRNSYLEASKAFAARFFTKESRICRVSDLGEMRQENSAIDTSRIRSHREDQELVESFLKGGTQEECEGFLEEYFRNVGEQNFQSVIYRQYVCMNFYFIVCDFLQELELNREQVSRDLGDVNVIVSKAASQEDMKDRLCEMLRRALDLRDSNSQKKNGVLLEEAKKFILENYQKEEMSLQLVASQVNISPSYFSTIFSSQTGHTFIEYLTSVRLDRAKELLMCTAMRTAEIGYEVGYRDSHYFSYIFKKVVGCSPKEYRNRRKEQSI